MAQLKNEYAPAMATGGSKTGFSTSLYVGDLDVNVTESQLYDLFKNVGQVVSVRVCRDLGARCYGYVNYNSAEDASKAMDALNLTSVNGKTIRIMYSHRDPNMRKSNIFVKNLDKEIDNESLHDIFSSFGNIMSCKVATDSDGASRGYGFVQFDTEDAAQKAIDKLNGMLVNEKQVFVGPFLRKQERDFASSRTGFNNVYVKNLSENTTNDDLKKTFGEHGKITSAVVMKDEDGKSKCFGFVNFETAEAAARAVESLNGYKFDNKVWYVSKAQKKSEREQELKEAAEKAQRLKNLYVKNLDDSVDDDKLKSMFAEFGSISSCKVSRHPSGISRGSGFVAFSSEEEASKAIAEMNGKMIVNKPLYVAVAQRKEERRALLQAQFSQMRPVATPAARYVMPPRMFYGQAPTMLPYSPHSQAAFGYTKYLVPVPQHQYRVPMMLQQQMMVPAGGRMLMMPQHQMVSGSLV